MVAKTKKFGQINSSPSLIRSELDPSPLESFVLSPVLEQCKPWQIILTISQSMASELLLLPPLQRRWW
jgi:hypothetical protein